MQGPFKVNKKHSKSQVKLAIIGCGAVARERYLPASRLVPNLEVTHVIDANIERAKEVANQFQVPNYTNDYHEIFGEVDAVVVATPPKLHAPITIDCLKNGIHVLCEKPMATSLREAQEMVKVSQDTKTHLAIGMNRRLCYSSQLAKFLIKNGFLGELERFEVEEGYEFNWPLQSLHLFKQEEAGGGVLAGTGPHLLDLLFWLVGKYTEIISYQDDNFGGVEANAQIKLKLKHNDNEIPGTIELSLTRNLRNVIRIFGERAYMDVPTLGGERVYLYPKTNSEQRVEMQFGDIRNRGRVEEFAEQLSFFADSILSGEIKYTPGTEALPVIECIEQCYKMRKSMFQSWEIKNLESTFSDSFKKEGKMPTILITGATGFVGTRLAERLILSGHAHIKALVHRLSSPGLARLARLPVELIHGDVLDLSSLLKATENCDVIVHCAYGGRRVTVKGTENVLKAAMENKVSKIIHFSTSVVHGRNPGTNLADESSPFKNDGDVYNKSKIEAEKIVWRYHQKYGLPVVVFRPTCIYGPYGRMWTIRPIEEIKTGAITLVNGGKGAANIVYIDNLIDAIFLAIEKEDAIGEAFIINDDEHLTWADFYQAYANMFSKHPPLREASLHWIDSINKMKGRNTLRKSILFPLDISKAIVRSPEVLEEVKKVAWLRFIAGKLPERIKDKAKEWIKVNKEINSSSKEELEGPASESSQIPSKDLIKLYVSNTRFSNTKLKQVLGWEQRIKFEDAMKLTREWLKYQRLIEGITVSEQNVGTHKKDSD